MIYDHMNSQFLSPEGLFNVVMSYIRSDCGQLFDYVKEADGKRRRMRLNHYNVNKEEELWSTPWGRMLNDPDLRVNTSSNAKRFRRRFRVPYSVFLYIVQRCKEAKMLEGVKIPLEFRLLIALRILGRGICADDIYDICGIAESTVNFIFHQFTKEFVKTFYDEFVSFPEGHDLDVVAQTYAEMGFPGACCSMDVTHVRLGKCPHGLRVLATGKEGYPTLGYQCICAPNRKVLYCSKSYLGSYNDITITANDEFCQNVNEGMLDDVRYKVVGEDGIPRWVSGGYLIVDGGYTTASWLMEPFPSGCSIEEKRWSEWLESVRKDIECTFGILKARFRLFMMAIQFHYFADIDNAWKTALILHNMLITYAGNDLADWEKNLNWAYIDPHFDTLEEEEHDEDYVVTMDDYFERVPVQQPRHRRRRHQPAPVTLDTTLVGTVFRARNVYDYYEKKKQLVSHFNYLFKLGLVKWPRRSGVALRMCMRVPKVDMTKTERTRYALYVRKSDFMLNDVPDGEDPRLGEGLFSHYGYRRGECIAVFEGVIMERDVYDDDALLNGTGGYSVALSHNRVLQSFHARWNGDCIASCANCANNCMNMTTGVAAVNNCRISVNNRTDSVKLLCNRDYIPPHTELAWDYGGDFQYPPRLPLP